MKEDVNETIGAVQCAQNSSLFSQTKGIMHQSNVTLRPEDDSICTIRTFEQELLLR